MRRSVHYSQNFLKNPHLVEQLVARSSLTVDDLVLDIGAGSGTITSVLARHCKKVLAYEADDRLAAKLVVDFQNTPNVKVIRGNFLGQELPNGPYKVFANIPFSKTSDIVRKLLDSANPPTDCYLIIQSEAAQKIMGGKGHESLFSVLHQPWFDVAITFRFKPSDFVPAPRVDIVLLYITRRAKPLVTNYAQTLYLDLVSYVFNHANPNILPSLQKLFPGKAFSAVDAAFGLKVTSKPTQLTMRDWLTLLDLFMKNPNQQSRRLTHGSYAKLRRESETIEKHHRTRVSKNWREEAAS